MSVVVFLRKYNTLSRRLWHSRGVKKRQRLLEHYIILFLITQGSNSGRLLIVVHHESGDTGHERPRWRDRPQRGSYLFNQSSTRLFFHKMLPPGFMGFPFLWTIGKFNRSIYTNIIRFRVLKKPGIIHCRDQNQLQGAYLIQTRMWWNVKATGKGWAMEYKKREWWRLMEKARGWSLGQW